MYKVKYGLTKYLPLCILFFEEGMPMHESLGMRIKLARTRRGLNQAALARKVGMSKNSMSLIERDLSNPAFAWVQKIAEVLNVSLDYLGGRNDEDTVPPPKHPRPRTAAPVG
jgi:transcriptional regulator with XRE-family HTH domain